jgi:hypothetical protein
MASTKTYDKVAWHFPEGQGCPSLDAAKIHFEVIMRWLESNGLLSEEGREALEVGVDSDFALTSHMLSDTGTRVLARCYSEWVRSVRYGEKPSVAQLDQCLRNIDGEMLR